MTPDHLPLFGHEKLTALATSDMRRNMILAADSRVGLEAQEGGGIFERWEDVKVGYNPERKYAWARASYLLDGKEFHTIQRFYIVPSGYIPVDYVVRPGGVIWGLA